MVCFGIDPGLGTLGYGIVRQRGDELSALDYGAIKTEPGQPISARLNELFSSLEKKIAQHGPDVIAVERLYFGRNTTTAEMVFQARGVALLAASRFGLSPYEPKPSEVKLAVCGNGAAEKFQVMGMVRNLLNLASDPRPDDAADALAIAITGLSLSMYDMRKNGGIGQ
ncbi:MAG: crossover junction endodeoxyribonuclease RuvC [Synergistaceae bacterium]|jgi:crossover junction endodeoxyribonuclease RuvC|nr:crossover junction endodeoxyribonuclease RuvC [Synergistaceae bacterium]